ncbi:pyrroline-5-carboxylate reductase [Sinorhizobium americanum]|uniref:Pyrroline-5-carboxylate reductase ProC n=1 Tax=Sinorhizobium americanum TaxID=194963 RepID=A0A1L3LZZ3_9HYPH|nr:pyrroline-5-carboxylate reductase [Sinorhizobium americanum]APG95660.1 pyrroline-5-carboxylate reductase ProC [Sinorhizobium americanum]OAP46132.1 pyrroline-5-carboxylate reductase [Sinorhizobium americanum]
MRIGFVGTGTITEAMVTGIVASPLDVAEIIVSPRSREIAARLAGRFPSVRIGRDNQEVVDVAEILFLAIRPQIAEEVIAELAFRKGQAVVSVIAATDRPRLLSWINEEVNLTQTVPLPFVADREGVTAIYPPNPGVAALFAALGTAVECETKEEYDLLAAASALMGTYFGILDRTTGWLAEKGMEREKARAYLAPLFASLAQTAVRAQATPLDTLRREFSTPGGLNEQVFADFERGGGSRALTEALEAVLRRIRR